MAAMATKRFYLQIMLVRTDALLSQKIQNKTRVVSGIMGHRVLWKIFQKMKPSGLEVR